MRNKATKKNMDLDLRRYGNNLYSKAEQSGGGGSDDGGSGGGDDSSNAFNGNCYFPAKHPFIAMIDAYYLEDIYGTYDFENPQNNPVYTIDTPILKTVDDVDSYLMSTIYTDDWPINWSFQVLYDMDELTEKNDSNTRQSGFDVYKEDANTKPAFKGPFYGTAPVKLNIDGKTFVTFILGG